MQTLRLVWGVCLGFLLSGCLSSVEVVTLPDGDEAHRIECNYAMSNCREEARDICGKRYEVIRGGDASCGNCGWGIGGRGSASNGPGEPAREDANSKSVFKGVLIVRCR